MGKPFDPIDQSVPCPEMGEGVVMRFTFSDLRKIEAHGNLSLALVSDTVREVMSGWSWVTFMLAKKDIAFAVPVFDLGLKRDGAPAAIDWDAASGFSFIELCAKAEIALLAALHGKTIDEARAEAERVQKEAQNPQTAQAGAS